jgi:adenosylcobyric acid synthase
LHPGSGCPRKERITDTSLAPCLFVGGTGSDVGKSVLVTAICRLFATEGLRPAPFKAQNMSNNAAVAVEGGEIGRAQAAQAQAAGLEPSVDMNPVLLKPEAEDRSQLIVRGQVAGTVSARAHWADREALWPLITDSLERLRRQHGVVVIEGAGSIAEVNLWDRDLANLRVARHAEAPIVLVGDIERGGIFAQLLGTLDLLPAADRRAVGGLVVNRFHGDRSLFDDGVAILEARSGAPVLGVMPFDPDLHVPTEDSASLRSSAGRADVAVIRYPRASNTDDLDGLRADGVGVRFVSDASGLGAPDLVVLPGSKATLADLRWLRAQGFAGAIRRLRALGTPILGLCGGYQMLGSHVEDASGLEGEPGAAAGLGLLPVRTALEPAKTTRITTGTTLTDSALAPAGTSFAGYEIHTGRTERIGGRPFASMSTERDGAVSDDGLVVGTYVHGILNDDAFRTAVLARLGPTARLPNASTNDWIRRSEAWLRGHANTDRLIELARGRLVDQ